MSQRVIYAVDHFAGAGGTSTGLALACKEKRRKVELTAINHWPKALETHRENHPWARHILTSIESTKPRDVVPGGYLNGLVTSPSCKYFSTAAGGRPKLDQGRQSAWQAVRWMRELVIDWVLFENVPEFMKWGPLDKEGRPIKERRGETFERLVHAMVDLGYNVEYRVLNAADYGAHTSRRRLFIIARLGTKPISWPKPTHSRTGEGLPKWLAAREVIDWSLKGNSIFTRKKPLSPNTLRRIIAGLKRFGGDELQPFLLLMEHGRNDDGSVRIDSKVKSLDDPVPTITTAKGGSMAVVEPFVLSQASGGAPRSVNEPVPTIPTKGAHALVKGVIISYHGGKDSEKRSTSTDEPLPTQDTQNRFAFVVPNFGERDGQEPRVHDVSNPLPSPTSHGAGCLVETEFILPVRGIYGSGNTPKSLDEPLGSPTQRGYGSLVRACIVKYHGRDTAQSTEEPLGTVTTKDRFAMALPFVVRLNGTTDYHINVSAKSVDDPLPAIVASAAHLSLVQPEIDGKRLDILFRMLQPHELAGAMDFPKSYRFKGNRNEVIKQIGNAVAVRQALALVRPLI